METISCTTAVLLCTMQKVFDAINAVGATDSDRLKINNIVVVEKGSAIRMRIVNSEVEVIFEKFVNGETTEAEGYVFHKDKEYFFGYMNGQVTLRGFRPAKRPKDKMLVK